MHVKITNQFASLLETLHLKFKKKSLGAIDLRPHSCTSWMKYKEGQL